jgi:hypothetical protein
VRILDDAVEREEGAIIDRNRIIITYNKESPTRSRIACLCRWIHDLFSFSIFLKPKVVGPDRAKTVAERPFDLPGRLLAHPQHVANFMVYEHFSICLVAIKSCNSPAKQTHEVRSDHGAPMVESALEKRRLQKKVEA